MISPVRTVAMLRPDEASLTTIAHARGEYFLSTSVQLRDLMHELRESIGETAQSIGLEIKAKDIQLFDTEKGTVRVIDKERGKGIGRSDILAIVNPTARQLGMVLRCSEKNKLQRAIIGSTVAKDANILKIMSRAQEIPIIQKNSKAFGIVHRVFPIDFSVEHPDSDESIRSIKQALLFPNVSAKDATTKEAFNSLTYLVERDGMYGKHARSILVEGQTDEDRG